MIYYDSYSWYIAPRIRKWTKGFLSADFKVKSVSSITIHRFFVTELFTWSGLMIWYPLLKLAALTWKMDGWKTFSFWHNLAGAMLMLVSGSVDTDFEITPTPQPKDYMHATGTVSSIAGLAHDLRAILRRCWRGGGSIYHGPTLAVINLANARGLENEMGKDR